MDWRGSLGTFSNYEKPPGPDSYVDEEEDFYGYGSNGHYTSAGASLGIAPTIGTANAVNGSNMDQTQGSQSAVLNGPPPPVTQTPEQKQLENQRKTAELRAKLLAQRQNTPGKSLSRANTPVKNAGMAPTPKVEVDKSHNDQQDEPSSDMFGLEALLAEGKAAAEANMKEQSTTSPATAPQPEDELPAMNEQQTQATPPKEISDEPMQPPQLKKPAETGTEQPKWSTKLTDAYYADLPIWLEVTGYHDIEYRNSKLHTHKERKALEEEAARIAERLEKLRQAEQASIESLRATPARSTFAAPATRPALPAVMPSADAAAAAHQTPATANKIHAPTTNGTKRAHSPEPVHSSKSRRDELSTGFRIRGANGSPTSTRHNARSPSPVREGGLERRISYPDARRGSLDNRGRRGTNGNGSRDPSLERRQAYYGRGPGPVTPAHGDQFDPPFGGRNMTRYENRGRLGYDNVGNRAPEGRGGKYEDYPQAYRGSAGLSLKRGGVQYFVIKSWNHENVVNAMRDGVWATQEKNEQMLTEAFKTCRHVILLFSVNKSMAFQGYALMTSPPDPSLPKPPFCAKLNWGTSPAFTLRWLATTPVHFRHVGHLKNELNRDEEGKAMAVLVGKDGQEISAEAGMGLVWILDEAQEVEGGKERGKGGMKW